MTNKEAINIISQMIKDEEGFLSDNTVKAHKIAIKALEQEPCDDVISRQAAIDIVDSYSESQSNVEDVTQDIISDISALPPATPQQKTGHWIALEEWKKDFKKYVNSLSMLRDDYKGIMEYIDELPVNPQPKTGKLRQRR